ncbi:MAG: TIGR02710 family CRISPR-associated protein [Planctomycetes bacterium]|nr:TIGR02710 family CRISPR-associated protein [Planctomycetota bacterium]
MPKAMIISVGGTPAPIIKSICDYKPEFVSFLASQDTCNLVTQIKSEVADNNVQIKSELTLVDNVNDLFHCHDKADEAVGRVSVRGYKKEEVIVDYTGGTKNMSVAVALAAITHGFSFSYVGGKERTKEGVGIVVNGQEVVYQSINPWDFLAIEEKKKIALLFNQYQFKAAKDLSDSLRDKSTKYKTLFKKIGFLIDGFHMWDLFRHSEARDCFKRAKIDELLEADDKTFKTFAVKTKELSAFLENIIHDGKKACMNLILDMFSNAERRFLEGKIDDAILRLYRLVEMVAQERLLSNYGIDSSDVKIEKIPDDLKDHYLQNYRNGRDGKIKIPQTAAFKLLKALGDELGRLFEDNETKFRGIQSSRNNSYLAHGYGSSKEETYCTLRAFILGLEVFNVDSIPVFPKVDI